MKTKKQDEIISQNSNTPLKNQKDYQKFLNKHLKIVEKIIDNNIDIYKRLAKK
jgi:hypothetical protein